MNLPNKLTTMRMVLVILLMTWLLIPARWINLDFFIFEAVYFRYFVAAIVFTIAAITDFFDGFLARRLDMVTTYGKFMDPIADKLLVNSSLIILAVRLNSRPFQATISVAFVVIMIARDVIVDGMRLVAASQNKVMAANKFGKIKTVLQMIGIVMYFFNGWPLSDQRIDAAYPLLPLVVMFFATLASVASGIIYIVQNRHVLKEEDASS